MLDLPLNYNGANQAGVNGINSQGDVVGFVGTTGTSPQMAALWKNGGTALTTLQPLTSSTFGSAAITSANAFTARRINDEDYSVGSAGASSNFSGGIDALLWDPNGNVTELGTYFPAGSFVTLGGTTAGWLNLTAAFGITNDGWITGTGTYYDPQAINSAFGANGSYSREFLIQVPEAVPEPASMGIFAVLAGGLLFRRCRKIGT